MLILLIGSGDLAVKRVCGRVLWLCVIRIVIIMITLVFISYVNITAELHVQGFTLKYSICHTGSPL